MNELDLIKEVEKRPILYDKSVSGFNKTKLRDEAWKEVQEALYVSEMECKKRWRSLRDSFLKLQRTHGGRTRWPYHHAMRFLLPHVGFEPKTNDASAASVIKSEPEDHASDHEEEPRIRQHQNNSQHHEDEPRIRQHHSQNHQQQLPSLPDLTYHDDEDLQPGAAKKIRQSSTSDDGSCSNCNRTDPDELFLLSCAPTLKRLNAKQNAVARLKIQQVLYEAEFGPQMELTYVTPAGDCSYEHIEGAATE